MTIENTEKTTVNLSIADLADIVNIIDYAASKGAFVGPDIEFVGTRRNKLQAFIEQNAPKESDEDKVAKEDTVTEEKPVKKTRSKSTKSAK
ncbi:MAG: hypothetical protein [Caudoviricetes sp.]|nr:MAG: hypothetical protein [Caudoviricetes sp.]